jgi:hypothetical protein
MRIVVSSGLGFVTLLLLLGAATPEPRTPAH